MKTKHQTTYTLFEAVAKNYKDHWDYRYNSMWSLLGNYGFEDTEQLEKYCKRVGLEIIKLDTPYYDYDFKINKEFIFNKIKNRKFKETATLSKSNGPDDEQFYNHFGIHEKACSVYGDKEEDIEDLILTIAKDQTIDRDIKEYWGFYDYADDSISLIYASYSLMSICFPGGASGAEKQGKGFPVKLNIKSLGKKKVK